MIVEQFSPRSGWALPWNATPSNYALNFQWLFFLSLEGKCIGVMGIRDNLLGQITEFCIISR